jgi:hypothetical protein
MATEEKADTSVACTNEKVIVRDMFHLQQFLLGMTRRIE